VPQVVRLNRFVFYNSPTASSADLVGAFNQAVTDNTVKVINASFGAAETGDPSFTTSLDPIFKQAILQGQTVSASSGDAGVYQASTSWSGRPGVPMAQTIVFLLQPTLRMWFRLAGRRCIR